MKSLILYSLAVVSAGAFVINGNLGKPKHSDELFLSDPEPTDSIEHRLNPILIVNDENNKPIPLRVSSVDVNIEVRGNRAVTTMDMSFINETDRILEGQLVFPLAEGQSVNRFALDVNGALREGVVVEKEKGQEVYEATIRQNVDPGLLELTQGNNYKARVYPIPAKGNKRLVIAYEQELVYEADQWLYLLPLAMPDLLDNFHLKVSVFQQEQKPTAAYNNLANLNFEKWQEHYVAEIKETRFRANKQLGFVVPVPKDHLTVLTGNAGAEHYFYGIVHPTAQERPKKFPQRICLLWDVSSSSLSRNIQNELDLLDGYFKKLQNATVKLVSFCNKDSLHPTNFSVAGGNWDVLRSELTGMPFDGATQLGELDLKQYTIDGQSPQEFILCSDGLSNFGSDKIQLGDAPVVCVSSSQSADFNSLKRVAMESGGQFINLNSTSIASAVKQISNQQFQFIRAEYNKAAVTECYPSVCCPAGEVFTVSGKFNGQANDITLHFGYGQEVTQSLKVSPGNSSSEDMHLKNIWSREKFNEMEILFPEDEASLASFAKENSLVTQFTSLIVLDRLEDYVSNKIVPPVELQEAYYAAIESEEKTKDDTYKTHLATVINLYKERVDWWNEDFTAHQHGMKPDSRSSGLPEGVADSVAIVTGGIPADLDADGIVNGQAISLGDEEISNSIEAGNVTLDLGNVSEDVSRDNNLFEFENGMSLNVMGKIGDRDKEKFREGRIELEKWSPDAPYLKELRSVDPGIAYTKYLQMKSDYAVMPAFYLDVADFFNEIGKKELALRILSNVAEIEIQNHELMRVLAHRLEQLGYIDLAIEMFRKVLKIRPEEPQSYRDLGLALAKRGDDQEAIEMLYKVVEGTWDERFPEIEVLAASEMNDIIASSSKQLNTTFIDEKLRAHLPCDMRVIITWDTDNCDMDLWVTDPRGETCLYNHNRTKIGGRISRDFTRGYGPEEFLIKRAMKGKYAVKINYYGSSRQTILGPTTVQVKLITGFGTPNEKCQEITRRLSESKEVLDIGEMLY